jgi:hypothetical protein
MCVSKFFYHDVEKQQVLSCDLVMPAIQDIVWNYLFHYAVAKTHSHFFHVLKLTSDGNGVNLSAIVNLTYPLYDGPVQLYWDLNRLYMASNSMSRCFTIGEEGLEETSKYSLTSSFALQEIVECSEDGKKMLTFARDGSLRCIGLL